MERRAVSSSNVRSVGYDVGDGTLEVEYKNGSLYQYSHVPEAVYSALMHAPSIGLYLKENVKDRYRYQRVR
jgi:hypothetical protein